MTQKDLKLEKSYFKRFQMSFIPDYAIGKFYEISLNNDKSYWYAKIRLNAYGYDFYQALKDQEFRNKIKNGLTDVSIDTLLSLGKKYIDKKVDTLF